MKLLSERIGDRTHGATLMECEQWAEEVCLKEEYIARLGIDLADARRENEALKKEIEDLEKVYSFDSEIAHQSGYDRGVSEERKANRGESKEQQT